MGLFSRSKQKIKVQSTRKDSYSGWLQCTDCKEMIHAKELEKNLFCCPKCNYHYRMTAPARITNLVDTNTFKELFGEVQPTDALNFVDTEPYKQRLRAAKKKSGMSEAVVVGTAEVEGTAICLGVLDFRFMGGSMGSVVGERLTRIIEHALDHKMPLIIVSASGGARMQESVLSLMQMAKTSAALGCLREAGVPYISILTNPTSGGVTASFAALGDVIIAEPKALICFAGPRVIEQTINQKLPEGAQKSEFLLKHGMIDCIVNRHELRQKLGLLIGYLSGNERQSLKEEAQQLATNLSDSLNQLMTVAKERKRTRAKS